MKTKQILVLSAIAFLLIGIVFVAGAWITKMNVESSRNEKFQNFQAQFEREKIFHDQTWKVISQIAQVDVQNDSMQLAFFEAWQDGISQTAGQSVGQAGAFPLLFQQAGITLNVELKKKLAQAIDDRTSEFTAVRTDLVAACQQYNTFVQDPWNKLFLPREKELVLECKVITSTRTQKAAETGVDDQTSIYK